MHITHTHLCACTLACMCVHVSACVHVAVPQAGSPAVAPREAGRAGPPGSGTGTGLCAEWSPDQPPPEWAGRGRPLGETAAVAGSRGRPLLQGAPGTRRLQPRKGVQTQTRGQVCAWQWREGPSTPKGPSPCSQPASGPSGLGQRLAGSTAHLPCPGRTLLLPLALLWLSCAPAPSRLGDGEAGKAGGDGGDGPPGRAEAPRLSGRRAAVPAAPGDRRPGGLGLPLRAQQR